MLECMQTCQKLQDSRAINIKNQDEVNSFLKKLTEVAALPGTTTLYPGAFQTAWLAITDEKEEGTWSDWYSGDKVDLSAAGKIGKVTDAYLYVDIFSKTFAYLDGGTTENCGIISILLYGWEDWICVIPPEHLIHCVCEKKSPVYLKLRGKCPDSELDTYWTPQTEEGFYKKN